ncbi:MAG: hypothetical protein PHE84_06680 [bacterium]|nr:hypothetical protein [bacterium]
MSKKDKICKICLISFLTLLGVGGMTSFALSEEPVAIPATDQSPENIKAGPEGYQALNEIGVYLDLLNKVENENLAPLEQTGSDQESLDVKSSEYRGDATLAILNELAFYLGSIKRMETAVTGDTKSSGVKPAAEPENTTPEVIEISRDQNGELNYLKVVWDNRDNESGNEKDSFNQ